MSSKRIPKDAKKPLCAVFPEMREKNKVPNSWKKLVLYIFEEKLSHKSSPITYIVGYDTLIEEATPSNLFYEGLFETTYSGIRRVRSKEEYLFVLTKENKFRSIHFSHKTFEKWSLVETVTEEERILSFLG